LFAFPEIELAIPYIVGCGFALDGGFFKELSYGGGNLLEMAFKGAKKPLARIYFWVLPVEGNNSPNRALSVISLL
jgi:hypothetical protein